ncbi:MAG: ATP-binding protein [Desulfococcaceae bacterium]
MKIKSLRLKINAAILTTCAVVILVFGAVIYPFEIQRRNSRFEEIRTLLTATYQQNREELANEIFSAQMEALRLSLNQILQTEGIARLTVYDLDGRYLLSTDTTQPIPLTPFQQTESEKAPTFVDHRENDRRYAVYTTPVQVIGERVGYLKIHYDLSEMERETFLTLLLFAVLVGSTILVTIAVLNLMLYRSVIHPVSMLRNAMGKVREGQVGEQVDFSGEDEIGQMGADFNTMSKRLQTQQEELMSAMEVQDTYFHKLEESNRALEALNAELEEKVEARTRELRLSNDQLRQEIEERKRADREKSELETRLARSQKMEALGLLAGGVAHDLNNVLSGIVSYPDLLLMQLPEDSSLRRPIRTIQNSGEKAAAIVQDLLTLARRGVTNTEIVNLNRDIIQDYLESPEFVKLTAEHPGIPVETRLEPKLMNIRGSSVHLKKTVMNLIVNAAEAQPDGGVIRITTQNRYVDRPILGYDNVQEGDYAVLTVSDEGTGIDPEDLNRIFEPFYTKKVMGRSGTGLGMAVVWGTVQDHKGYINVQSVPGAGTAFELFFPVTRDAAAEPSGPTPLTDYMGEGETVLVVDDIEEQREIAFNLLTRLNYRVAVAACGETALQHLKTHPTDILVLDMILENGMDGLDICKAVIRFNPDQKVIIASGFAENERVREAQRLGAGAYIKKPYTLEKIGKALRWELKKARPI